MIEVAIHYKRIVVVYNIENAKFQHLHFISNIKYSSKVCYRANQKVLHIEFEQSTTGSNPAILFYAFFTPVYINFLPIVPPNIRLMSNSGY